MPMAMHLIALDSDAPADTRARIAGIGRLAQAMPPRLMVVEAPAEAAVRLATMTGVRLLAGADSASALSEPLSDGEQLFVDGFFAARRKPGPMPGESLPWDAPGFSPPDPPPGRQPGT